MGYSKRSVYTTPNFVVYDSDSLKSNKEIFLITQLYINTTTAINLSNAEGDDYSAHIGLYSDNDSLYVAVLWIHEQNGKKDIGISTTKFDPGMGAVIDPAVGGDDFVLMQNYPNPFSIKGGSTN